jgi:hypothetical protein
MGAAYFIVVQKPIPGMEATAELSGVALAAHESELNQLARNAGVTPLMNFISMSESDYAPFVDDDDDPADSGVFASPAAEGAESVIREVWFTAADGLKTVRALLRRLELPDTPMPEKERIVFELNKLRQVLAAAEHHEIRWHLLIDV